MGRVWRGRAREGGGVGCEREGRQGGDVWGEERVGEGEEGGVVYAGPRSCSTQNSKSCAAFQLWTPTVF